MNVIAERRLVAVYPGVASVPVCLRIGRPQPRPDGEWACPVQGEGLRLWEGPIDLLGVDGWQALMIGLRFLREMLTREAEQGTVFHWENGEGPVSLDEVFA